VDGEHGARCQRVVEQRVARLVRAGNDGQGLRLRLRLRLLLRLRLRLRLRLLLRRHRPGSFQTMETTTMETILYSGPPHLPLLQLLHPRPPSSLTTETTTTTMTLCSVLPRPLRPLLRPPLRRRLPRL